MDDLLQSQQVERTQATEELAIQANSFGGLNVTANPLNIPYEDSPLMQNVVTDLSGAIIKRKGTRVLYRANQAYNNITLMPVATSLNYNLLCVKASTSLEVYELNNNTTTKVMTKANVWSDTVAQTRANWVLTSDPEPRLVICTGANKPVQVQFLEAQAVAAGATSNIVFPNAERLRFAAVPNCLVWVNRQRYTNGYSFTYNATTKQLSLNLMVPVQANDVVDLTLICWQWWAEAQHWYGDRFYGSQTRFNAVPADQVVKVPPKLTVDLRPEEAKAQTWEIYAWKKSRSNTLYNRNTNGNPQGADDYWFSDGTRYIYDTDNRTNASPYFITFGSTTGTTPTTVYFSRKRALKFRSGEGQFRQFIDVFVDGVKKPQYLDTNVANDPNAGVEAAYGLVDTNGVTILNGNNNTNNLAALIEFHPANLGVRPLSVVEYVNTERTHIGSAAGSSRFNYLGVDGAYVPIYGLGQYADYFNGFYPSVVSAYQNRLVLSGFAHRPMLVLFSNVSDSVTPGERYNFFQITDDELSLLDSSPFDLEIEKKASDDRVTAMVEWQRSLFVLTRRATYRVSGSAERPLKFDNKFTTYLSSTGCVNSNTVVQTETSIYYLSDNGLYDLLPRVEDGEFKVTERSMKIRKFFGLTSDPRYEELAWLAYDPQEKYIYVGYPAPGNTYTTVYMYVYNVSRNSWTEFNTQGYFRCFDAVTFIDRSLGQVFISACTTEQNESSGGLRGRAENFILLKFSDDHYVDYYDIRSRASTGETYPTLQIPDIQFTPLTSWEQTFKYGYASIGQFRGYQPNPFTDVEDVECIVTSPNTVSRVLKFGSEWVKKPSETFYIAERLPANTNVSFRWKPQNGLANSQGFSHISVWVNRDKFTNWTLLGSGNTNDKYLSLPLSVPVGSIVEWGFVYSAVYATPVFFNSQLGNYKRLKHAYLFFDNEGGSDVYRAYETNTAVGQDYEQVTDRYKQRINANISVLYNAEQSGYVSSDIYGFDTVYWDDNVFDFDPSSQQAYPYSVFKEPLQGVGYSYQLSVWSYDEARWKLGGYQIDVKQKGKRYGSRS